MATPGRKALVKVSGAPVTLANAATTADGARFAYTITNVAQRVLDHSAAVTVETSPDGTNWSAASGYTLDRLFGRVIFGTARPTGTQVRVSGKYVPMTTAAEAKGFSQTATAKNDDASVFGDTFVRRDQVQRDITGSLNSFRTTDKYFDDALTAGNPVVIEFALDGTVISRAWALLNSEQIQAAVDSLIEQDVEWEGAADADGRAISYA